MSTPGGAIQASALNKSEQKLVSTLQTTTESLIDYKELKRQELAKIKEELEALKQQPDKKTKELIKLHEIEIKVQSLEKEVGQYNNSPKEESQRGALNEDPNSTALANEATRILKEVNRGLLLAINMLPIRNLENTQQLVSLHVANSVVTTAQIQRDINSERVTAVENTPAVAVATQVNREVENPSKNEDLSGQATEILNTVAVNIENAAKLLALMGKKYKMKEATRDEIKTLTAEGTEIMAANRVVQAHAAAHVVHQNEKLTDPQSVAQTLTKSRTQEPSQFIVEDLTNQKQNAVMLPAEETPGLQTSNAEWGQFFDQNSLNLLSNDPKEPLKISIGAVTPEDFNKNIEEIGKKIANYSPKGPDGEKVFDVNQKFGTDTKSYQVCRKDAPGIPIVEVSHSNAPQPKGSQSVSSGFFKPADTTDPKGKIDIVLKDPNMKDDSLYLMVSSVKGIMESLPGNPKKFEIENCGNDSKAETALKLFILGKGLGLEPEFKDSPPGSKQTENSIKNSDAVLKMTENGVEKEYKLGEIYEKAQKWTSEEAKAAAQNLKKQIEPPKSKETQENTQGNAAKLK